MHPKAQLRALEANNYPRMTIGKALALLALKEKVIADRRCRASTQALKDELYMCEIRRCVEILKELT